MSYRQYYAELIRRKLICEYLRGIFGGDNLILWRPLRGKRAPLFNKPFQLEVEYHQKGLYADEPVLAVERVMIDPHVLLQRPERKDMDDPFFTIAYEDDKECSFCGRKLSLYEEIQFHPVKRWAKCRKCVEDKGESIHQHKHEVQIDLPLFA